MKQTPLAIALAIAAATCGAAAPAFRPPPAATYRCYLSEKDWADPKAVPFATLQLDADNSYRFMLDGKSSHSGRYQTQPLDRQAGGSIALLERDERSAALSGIYGLDEGGRAAFLLKNPKSASMLVRCGDADTARAVVSSLHRASAPAAQAAEAPPPPPRYAAAPGRGLKPQQIVGLAQQIEYRGMTYDPMSRMWTGGHSVEDYLLLADGSIRKGWPEALPLEDFDAEASRRAEPEQWGRYTARGRSGAEGVYEVTWNKGERETLKLSFSVPARPDERLRGFFYQVGTASTGAPGNGTFSSAWGGITFRPDGRFETASGGSSDYSGGTGSVTATSRQASQGSYRLSGTLLELRFDDGRVERRQFVFTSDEKDWIVVNGRRLLLRK